MAFDVVQIRSLQGNAFLIKGKHVAVIDTLGKGEFRWLSRGIEKEGVKLSDIEYILLTHHHVDHAANAAALKELSGAKLVAGALDSAVVEGDEQTPPPGDLSRVGRFLGKLPSSLVDRAQRYRRIEVDLKAEGGEVIEDLGLEIIPLPGHTRGGVGFLSRNRRSAFTGDMISSVFSKPCMPSLAFSESLDEIFASQQFLAGMDLETIYPGHGRVIEHGASTIIGDYSEKMKAKLAARR